MLIEEDLTNSFSLLTLKLAIVMKCMGNLESSYEIIEPNASQNITTEARVFPEGRLWELTEEKEALAVYDEEWNKNQRTKSSKEELLVSVSTKCSRTESRSMAMRELKEEEPAAEEKAGSTSGQNKSQESRTIPQDALVVWTQGHAVENEYPTGMPGLRDMFLFPATTDCSDLSLFGQMEFNQGSIHTMKGRKRALLREDGSPNDPWGWTARDQPFLTAPIDKDGRTNQSLAITFPPFESGPQWQRKTVSSFEEVDSLIRYIREILRKTTLDRKKFQGKIIAALSACEMDIAQLQGQDQDRKSPAEFLEDVRTILSDKGSGEFKILAENQAELMKGLNAVEADVDSFITATRAALEERNKDEDLRAELWIKQPSQNLKDCVETKDWTAALDQKGKMLAYLSGL